MCVYECVWVKKNLCYCRINSIEKNWDSRPHEFNEHDIPIVWKQTNLVVDGLYKFVEFSVNGDEVTERNGLRGVTIELWPDLRVFVTADKFCERFVDDGGGVVCADAEL